MSAASAPSPAPGCCRFFESAHVSPGWFCGVCRGYNGLQRDRCSECQHERCELVIPLHVRRCVCCGFGWPVDWPALPERCPSCLNRFVAVPA